MGLLISNCLKGMHDDFPVATPYRRQSGRKAQLQNMLSNKSNPDVDGRKLSQPPPVVQDASSAWGRPSTPQADDSPGPPTPGSGSSYGYGGGSSGAGGFFSNQQTNYGSTQPQSTNAGIPGSNRPRKVSFNFHQSSASTRNDREKNCM